MLIFKLKSVIISTVIITCFVRRNETLINCLKWPISSFSLISTCIFSSLLRKQARSGGGPPLDFFEGRKCGNTINSQWKLKYYEYIISVTYKHVCYNWTETLLRLSWEGSGYKNADIGPPHPSEIFPLLRAW